MRILILGNSWHGNWSKTIYEEIISLGHTAEHIDVRYTKKYRLHILESFRRRSFFRRLNKSLVEKIDAGNFDVCLAITPYTIPNSLWKHLKERGLKLIGWWGDDPMSKGNLSESMSFFDKIYLVDKEWVYTARYFNKNTYYLPHAVSEKNFFQTNSADKKIDVLFVGASFEGKMDGRLRANVLRILHENGIRISLYGDLGWKYLFPQYHFLKEIYKGSVNTASRLNELYNSSKIVLNVHHRQLITGTNQRSFEVAATGTLQIADYRQDIEDIFGENIVTFSSPKDLVDKFKYYIDRKKDRTAKGSATRKIAQDHTYKQRLSIILDI